jgi:phosphoglycerol transferase MdoB-like AlkP superfamily enzyme
MQKIELLKRHGWLILLALVWTAEIWLVQRVTTAPTLWHDPVAVIKDQVFRAILDLGIVTIVLLTAPRWFLIPLFFINFLFAGVLISYHETYDRAMSVFVVLEQWREGAAVAGGGAMLIIGTVACLAASAFTKYALAWKARDRIGKAPTFGAGLAVGWLAFVVILDLDHKDMARLRTFEQTAGIAHVYGYLPTWVGEYVYVDQNQVLDEALARLQVRSNRLGDVETSMPTGSHVVLLQVESLDDAVIDFEIDGREVTPNLNRIRQQSFYFRSQAPKLTGSCDTDFVALMGRLPSARIVSYRIDELPFETAVVPAFADAGYRTGVFHGVSGNFFHRRDAFSRMNFDVMRFREEFIDERDANPEEWTVADGAVLEWAAEWLNSSDERTFMMVITATSHLPFNFPTPGMEPTFFPGASSPNHAYFDSIHYVDHQIGMFVDSLPPGTTVLIYGDHWSKMSDTELAYQHTVIDGFGLVPVIVHVVGEDISDRQQTRNDELALSGQLTLLDLFTWAWGSLQHDIAWSADGRVEPPTREARNADPAPGVSSPLSGTLIDDLFRL